MLESLVVTTARLLQNENKSTFISCNPPPSYNGAKGMAGRVGVQLSLDGQHLLEPAMNYTYVCEGSDFYYVPAPERGECTACANGAKCFGNQTVVAQQKWYAVKAPTLFQKCLNPKACERADLMTQCAKNFEGPLCKHMPSYTQQLTNSLFTHYSVM